MGTIVASIYYHIAINPELSWFYLIPTTLILATVGQIGDLVFSAIKRYYGKKCRRKIFL